VCVCVCVCVCVWSTKREERKKAGLPAKQTLTKYTELLKIMY